MKRQSKFAWWLGFIVSRVYEKDPEFREYITRLTRTGLVFAGIMSIFIASFYLGINTLFFGKKVVFWPQFGLFNAISLADKLALVLLGIIAIIFSLNRRLVYWGRLFVFTMIPFVCAAALWEDVIRGDISRVVGYLLLVLLVITGTMPFQAWQILLLGGLVTAIFLLSISLFGVPDGFVSPQVEPQSLALLILGTILCTIIIGFLYRSRYIMFRARQKQYALRQQVTDYAHALEQANIKIQETQEQLIQAGKMAALGNLVAGVAHEVNSPLGAIQSNADTAQRAISIVKDWVEKTSKANEGEREDLKIQTAINTIVDLNDSTTTASRQIDRIVSALRGFACLDQAELQDCSLQKSLDDTITILKIDSDSDIKIIKEYMPLPNVSCDPSQINQVFMQILNNALEAVGKKGTITIKTFVKNSQAVIQINDTGKGISASNLSRIFDPGFTTKGVRVGTGLGLSICYRYITGLGGRIDVESNEGRGTAVSIHLPCRESKEPQD